jgi:DNA-binding FadR family transcriptional regulator
MPPFKSLRKPPLSKEVEEQLRKSINAGVYTPGDKLPSERELVDQFQVSRVTVRDALKNLQILGLISVKRGIHAGAYVSEPNPQPITQSIDNLVQMGKLNFAHLIEIRLYIEPDVARNVALHCTPEDVEKLKALLGRAESDLETSRKKARLTNVRFHSEVANITHNALIIFLSESITQVYSAMLIEMTHTKLDKKGIEKLIAEHRTIMDAIADHDPDAAFERTKKHLIKTYRMYSRLMPDSYDKDVHRRIKYFAEL